MPLTPLLNEARSVLASRLSDDPGARQLDRTALLLAPCVPALLRELSESEAELARAAAESYPHHNGFDRIVLASLPGASYSLRLHLWWGDVTRREHVHGHPWNFGSVVLAGELHYEYFQEGPDGDLLHEYNYPLPTDPAGYRLIPSGRTVRLQTFARGVLPVGSHYWAGHPLLHRVWTEPGVPTATLMIHGPGVAYPSRVFLPEPADSVSAVRVVSRFSPAELAQKLVRALSLLPAPAPVA